jgi:hypothetical protein
MILNLKIVGEVARRKRNYVQKKLMFKQWISLLTNAWSGSIQT